MCIRDRIVNIASISGRQGTALLSAYCAAKHGVVGLTRSLAEELRADGIAVNAVCPGSVDTPMLQVGMPGAKPDMSPEDVAGVVLYLAAEARYAHTHDRGSGRGAAGDGVEAAAAVPAPQRRAVPA